MKPEEYLQRLIELVELERREEINAMISEIRSISGWKREKLGRAILGLKGKRVGREFDYYLVRYSRDKEIKTEIGVGDLVLISRGDPLKSDLVGTVAEKRKRSITVALDQVPEWALGRVRIDLYVNDITFRRMIENLERLKRAEGRLKELRDIIIGLRRPASPKKEKTEILDKELNESQVKAVELSLGSKDFFLIHGPPGTGKTRTLVEVIRQEVKRGRKVLATAESNVAVDNLLEGLLNYEELKVVRIGHPARVSKRLWDATIYRKVEKKPLYRKVEEFRERAQLMAQERDRFQAPIQQYRRGLSDEEILRLSEKGLGVRGVSPRKIKEMAKWIKTNRKVQELYDRARKLEELLIKQVLEECDVVVTTNSSSASDFLNNVEFDVVVIDEATQATEPSVLIPISKAKKFVMAGDHKQLPPTILSLEARELSKTLFEKLIERENHLSSMLRVQYRMNEKIMAFSNEEFYSGKLEAHESVRGINLSDLGVKEPNRFKEVLDPKEPLVFVDTSRHREKWERQRPGSTSRENPLEAKIVIEILKELVNMGVDQREIGVITPYDDQVDLIRTSVPEEWDIEIHSVDAFQGREKEVIIISFVRSNPDGELGFLNDLRRLNVSITRAKRKLICIGDSSTLEGNPTYRRFLEYIRREGAFLDLVDLIHRRYRCAFNQDLPNLSLEEENSK